MMVGDMRFFLLEAQATQMCDTPGDTAALARVMRRVGTVGIGSDSTALTYS